MKKIFVIILHLLLIFSCKINNGIQDSVINNNTTDLEVDKNLIFAEDFDNQPDWHSGLLVNSTNPYINDGLGELRVDKQQLLRTGHTIPIGWTGVRQGEHVFSPRDPRYPNSKENIEILSSNSSKARGGVGKSVVFWRDSYQDNRHMWNSDGILSKHLSVGYDELYVEFWITFDNNTTKDSLKKTNTGIPDMSKLFRIMSWGEEKSEFQNGAEGNLGPIFIWNWRIDDYGIRNMLTTRGGPHGENYTLFDKDDFSGMPKIYGTPVANGSFNYTHTFMNQGPNGETEWPIDRINGGLIKDHLNGKPASHEQVYGRGGDWTKMAFYVKMNSDPQAKDGVIIQWVNGRRVLSNYEFPWYKTNTKNIKPKWNLVALGGNDYFHSYPRSAQREEWYAIDDVKIYSGIPAHAEDDINFE